MNFPYSIDRLSGLPCARSDGWSETKDHAHLYFTIPAGCLLPDFWELNELDELELYISHEEPAQEIEGRLIFCE